MSEQDAKPIIVIVLLVLIALLITQDYGLGLWSFDKLWFEK